MRMQYGKLYQRNESDQGHKRMIDETYRDKRRMTESQLIASMCYSPARDSQHKLQAESYRSGRALSGHVKDAHNGVEDPKCPACKEIRMRCGL